MVQYDISDIDEDDLLDEVDFADVFVVNTRLNDRSEQGANLAPAGEIEGEEVDAPDPTQHLTAQLHEREAQMLMMQHTVEELRSQILAMQSPSQDHPAMEAERERPDRSTPQHDLVEVITRHFSSMTLTTLTPTVVEELVVKNSPALDDDSRHQNFLLGAASSSHDDDICYAEETQLIEIPYARSFN